MKIRYVVFICLLALSLICVGVFFGARASVSDTRASSFGEDYARIAVYPEELITYDGINAFRVNIDERLISDSHSANGRLWYDGFISFGRSSVSALDSASFMAEKITAGGDFFTLYDLDFLTGTPFYSDDNYSDRAVIDERCSFRLFGSVDSIDMPIVIDSKEYYVAGVFRAEDSKAWSVQFGEEPVVIIPDRIADGNLYSAYEIVLPDPVNNYALGVVSEAVGDNAVTVDVTNRYSLKNLFSHLPELPYRSYVTRDVAFPWFENSARGELDRLSVMLALSLISVTALAVSGVYIIIRRKK